MNSKISKFAILLIITAAMSGIFMFVITGGQPVSSLITVMLSFILGGLFSSVLMMLLMPNMMLTTHLSRYNSVEETCRKLEEAIQANGWYCPAVRNINQSISKHGGTLGREVQVVELCNSEYGADVLKTNPEVSTLMPCAWGVYQGDDGRVYITGMNTGMMGKMFGGNIARVMGGNVAEDEEKILGSVIKTSSGE